MFTTTFLTAAIHSLPGNSLLTALHWSGLAGSSVGRIMLGYNYTDTFSDCQPSDAASYCSDQQRWDCTLRLSAGG